MPNATTLDAIDLSGRCILVVEDDFYLASDTARFLTAAGATIIGPLPRSEPALAAMAGAGIDAAVVDINLGEGLSFELADALQEAGVPFVFVTGYDEILIPPRLASVETVQKPAEARRVLEALARLLRDDSA